MVVFWTYSQVVIGSNTSQVIVKWLVSRMEGKPSWLYTTPCPEKNIPNIIDCHLKKRHPILIIFGEFILGTTGRQVSVQYSSSPIVCFCTTWGKQNIKI